MVRKKRYADKTTLGSVDQRISADPKKRHYKRYTRANKRYRNAGLAFASIGGWLQIKNDGHHWMITFPKGRVVEWFPSTAKLAVDKQWKKTIHAHTWQQVFNYLRRMKHGTKEFNILD